MSGNPSGAVIAHDAYWRVKETGEPPAFTSQPAKLQQCWAAAAQAVAAAERERILVPDETLHADGSIGPDAVPPGLSPDPAYWYRRWLFALKQLDKEGSERMSAYAVAAQARAAERERIRQLAHERAGALMQAGKSCGADAEALWAFAGLIGGDA